MPKIIYKDKKYVAIIKPAGMPSQSDLTGDVDAMTATSKLLGELGEKVALWLVHRLDRTVGGVMVFARSKESAAEISREIAEGTFDKEYLAVAEGVCEDGEMRDFLFKDSTLSKAFVVKTERKGAKLAVLESQTEKTVTEREETLSLVRIKLKTGRFHQIRAQFSHRGHPLVGDKKYGSRDDKSRTPALYAVSVTSRVLNGGRKISALPDKKVYPWSLFDL